MDRVGYLEAVKLTPRMSRMRKDPINSEPTLVRHLRYEVEGDGGFGTYQGQQVQDDELVPPRNCINPIASQVRVCSHSDVLETDLMVMKTSEEMMKNIPRIEATSTLRTQLTSFVRRCPRN